MGLEFVYWTDSSQIFRDERWVAYCRSLQRSLVPKPICSYNGHSAYFSWRTSTKKSNTLYANMRMQNENEAVSHISPLMEKSEMPSTTRSQLSNKRKNFEICSVVLILDSFRHFEFLCFSLVFHGSSPWTETCWETNLMKKNLWKIQNFENTEMNLKSKLLNGFQRFCVRWKARNV